MPAVRYSGPERVEVADPDPGPDEVRIAVERLGVHGTDLHVRHAAIMIAGRRARTVEATIRLRPYDLFRRGLTVLGSFAHTSSMTAAIDFLSSGGLDPGPLLRAGAGRSGRWSRPVRCTRP